MALAQHLTKENTLAVLMKGHTFKDRKHKLTYPVGVDLKYDEVRVHVIVGDGVQFLSYAGKPLHNMQGFAPLFAEVSKLTGWKVFDCGLEINENFNDTYRWVRSSKGLPADLSKATWRFWLFDLPNSTIVSTNHDAAGSAASWFVLTMVLLGSLTALRMIWAVICTCTQKSTSDSGASSSS